MLRLFAPKGSEFKCPYCGDLVAIAEKDLLFRDPINPVFFTFPQGHKMHDFLGCKRCGHDLNTVFRDNQNWHKKED